MTHPHYTRDVLLYFAFYETERCFALEYVPGYVLEYVLIDGICCFSSVSGLELRPDLQSGFWLGVQVLPAQPKHQLGY